VLTAEGLEAMVARKSEILAFLRDAQVTSNSVVRPIVPISRKDVLPLSFAQHRIWFWERMNGASATYNVPIVLRLKGALDANSLIRSLQGIVQSHEALRTSFFEVEGEPRQVIHEHFTLELPTVDATEADLSHIIKTFAREPFDLARGPLIRTNLLRLS